MLLETKGVVHLALLFGSTWIVNSIVFFAILVMVLLSNLYVVLVKPKPACLVLWVAHRLTGDRGLFADGCISRVAGRDQNHFVLRVTFVPIFFAGVVFATEFRDSKHPDVDFGSNIGGVILGGLSENFSLIVGFKHLLLLAAGYYLVSAMFRRRIEPPA